MKSQKKSVMALSKFDEFMHWRNGHDANETHDNFNIIQELKTSFHSFNGMEISFILTTKD